MNKEFEEYALLGISLIKAQEIEFTLYGIIVHLKDDVKERRFKSITPENFLRGDINELKATAGQLAKSFEESVKENTNPLFFPLDEINNFVEKRNLIAHSYLRLKNDGQLHEPCIF